MQPSFGKKLFCLVPIVILLSIITFSYKIFVYRSPIHSAAKAGNIKKLKNIINENSNSVNLKDFQGASPLHFASRENKSKAIVFLVNHGANVNAIAAGGQTPLHWACTRKHHEAVATLLSMGADPNMKDTINRRTALHYGVFMKDIKLVQLLLDSNANPLIKDKKGYTPRDLSKDGKIKSILP